MEFNWWDDRTYDVSFAHPCAGCGDYKNGKCISNGACAEREVNKESEAKQSKSE